VRALTVGAVTLDCLYLALALRLGVPFVTADRRFAERAVAVHPETQNLLA
jgi:predicted nucleic acid-binding protein